ncbi:hypothetical protein ACUXST_000137 [Sphingomonas sp. F9_3S_D5_B_2]
MRVTSDEKLAKASELRRGGKSWLELSKSQNGKSAGLEFFRSSKQQSKDGTKKAMVG